MTEEKELPNQLLKSARAGDQAALESLLTELQPQLYRFAMLMCHHREDAEDVTQDALLAVVRGLSSFRGDAKLSTWTFTIARRFCGKRRRRDERSENLSPAASLEQSSPWQRETAQLEGPEARAERGELWAQLEEGIRALPKEHREVLLLRDVEGLRAKEVAEVIGISVSAVKSRLHRARRTLRELIAPERPRDQGCPDIRQRFSEHLEGELESQICVDLQAHIDACPRCARECDGLKQLLNLCGEVSCDPSPLFKKQLRAALALILDP